MTFFTMNWILNHGTAQSMNGFAEFIFRFWPQKSMLSEAQTTILPVHVAMLGFVYTYANQAIALSIPQSVI